MCANEDGRAWDGLERIIAVAAYDRRLYAGLAPRTALNQEEVRTVTPRFLAWVKSDKARCPSGWA